MEDRYEGGIRLADHKQNLDTYQKLPPGRKAIGSKWCYKIKQNADGTVALSSAEAEYISLCTAAQEAVYLRRIIAELGENISGPTRIWQDNQGTMKIANDFISNRRTKHIEIKFHYTREKITNGEIDVDYLPTSEMPADILTKPIGPIILEKMLTTFFGT